MSDTPIHRESVEDIIAEWLNQFRNSWLPKDDVDGRVSNLRDLFNTLKMHGYDKDEVKREFPLILRKCHNPNHRNREAKKIWAGLVEEAMKKAYRGIFLPKIPLFKAPPEDPKEEAPESPKPKFVAEEHDAPMPEITPRDPNKPGKLAGWDDEDPEEPDYDLPANTSTVADIGWLEEIYNDMFDENGKERKK